MKPDLQRRIFRWIAAALIALGAAVLPWLWCNHSGIRLFTQVWSEGKVDDFTRNWTQLDRNFLDAAGSGNLALRFVGFNPNTPGHVRIVQEACWRGAYALYPRQVLVAEPGTLINNAADILATPFNPTDRWLQDHNVRAVLTLIATGEQTFAVRPQAVPPRGGR